MGRKQLASKPELVVGRELCQDNRSVSRDPEPPERGLIQSIGRNRGVVGTQRFACKEDMGGQPLI